MNDDTEERRKLERERRLRRLTPEQCECELVMARWGMPALLSMSQAVDCANGRDRTM
jgi:hypothetical protein